MDAVNSNISTVVARFLDGRVLKGTTQDFAPHKPIFHLVVRENPSERALVVPLLALKALFFVRSFDGNPKHEEDLDLEKAKGPGRKVAVTFTDGEVLCGLTTGYNKDKQGFFVIPVDPESNNARVYVVTSSVKKVEWAGSLLPGRALG